jgi:HSP20 family molecular chaperone IbpA
MFDIKFPKRANSVFDGPSTTWNLDYDSSNFNSKIFENGYLITYHHDDEMSYHVLLNTDDRENVNITQQGNLLKIYSVFPHIEKWKNPKTGKIHKTGQKNLFEFQKTLVLPKNVDYENIDATMEGNWLIVTLYKKNNTENKGKKIEIT